MTPVFGLFFSSDLLFSSYFNCQLPKPQYAIEATHWLLNLQGRRENYARNLCCFSCVPFCMGPQVSLERCKQLTRRLLLGSTEQGGLRGLTLRTELLRMTCSRVRPGLRRIRCRGSSSGCNTQPGRAATLAEAPLKIKHIIVKIPFEKHQ